MLLDRYTRPLALAIATGLLGILLGFQPAVAQTPPAVVSMAYNIHHGVNVSESYNLQAIADVINAQTPGLVALNEVDKGWGSRSNFEDQPARLAQMTGLNACYGPNLTNVSGGQYGNLILSRYVILECRNRLLPKVNQASEQRGLVEVLVEIDGQRVRFYGTHLEATSADDRRVQVNDITQYTDTQPELKIIAGDFNALPTASELQPMYARFIDAWQAKGLGNGYTYPSDQPTARIDYVYHSSAMGTTSVQVVQSLASDHLAVVAYLGGSGGGADTQPPSAPTNLTATGAKRKVTLGWTAATDNVAVTGYQVWRATSAAGPFTQITTVTGTSYTHSGLTSGTTYWYNVKATDAAGNVSAASNTASATAR